MRIDLAAETSVLGSVQRRNSEYDLQKASRPNTSPGLFLLTTGVKRQPTELCCFNNRKTERNEAGGGMRLEARPGHSSGCHSLWLTGVRPRL